MRCLPPVLVPHGPGPAHRNGDAQHVGVRWPAQSRALHQQPPRPVRSLVVVVGPRHRWQWAHVLPFPRAPLEGGSCAAQAGVVGFARFVNWWALWPPLEWVAQRHHQNYWSGGCCGSCCEGGPCWGPPRVLRG